VFFLLPVACFSQVRFNETIEVQTLPLFRSSPQVMLLESPSSPISKKSGQKKLSFLKLKFMAFWGGVFPIKPTILPRSSEHTGNGGNYTLPQNWET